MGQSPDQSAGQSPRPPAGRAPLGEGLRKVEAELAAGHAEQALALCQEAQARYPRALAAQRALGEVYLTLRKPREALGALERALAGDPEDARALCARAIIHQMHGDSAAALAWYRRACDVRPDDQVLRATYRELAAHLGQPPYRPTRLGLARLYLRGGLLTHALREWETLAAEHPEQLEAQVGLAETLWRAGRAQVAEEQCRRILANAPSCVKAHVLLASLLLDRGLRDEAARHAERSAELDPDQRIAQALFADRLAGGDQALAALLSGSPSASRPLTATLRAPLPAGAQQLLSETAYMLWGPDEETRARAAVAARATVTDLGNTADAAPPNTKRAAREQPPAAPPDAAGHATRFVPPALVEQGGSMNDTEALKALGWVQWLQAQGARVHPSVPSAPGAAPAVSGSQPALGAAQPAASAPLGRTTGPLAPTTEALRAMFAELDGGARAPTAGPAQPLARSGAPGASRSPMAWDTGAGQPTGWLAEDAAQPHLLRRDRRETETERLAQAHALSQGVGAGLPPDAVTLEALERQFAESGFQPVEPQPGLLAAMSSLTSSHSPSFGPERVELPSSLAEDYPGRLRLAHAWRTEGRLDDALAEYRALLKQAPALLPELLDELHECLRQAPEHPEAHRLLGDARIQQGDYLGALEAYNRAVALTHPDSM
jgi:tetratricopeptide (TPR) repeat protein